MNVLVFVFVEMGEEGGEKKNLPPIPMTPTFFPGPQPFCFRGLYVVTPPHSIGAAISLGIASGIWKTKCELPLQYLA